MNKSEVQNIQEEITMYREELAMYREEMKQILVKSESLFNNFNQKLNNIIVKSENMGGQSENDKAPEGTDSLTTKGEIVELLKSIEKNTRRDKRVEEFFEINRKKDNI